MTPDDEPTKAPEEIRFQAELPYNETGKLLRRALKAQFAPPAPAGDETVAAGA